MLSSCAWRALMISGALAAGGCVTGSQAPEQHFSDRGGFSEPERRLAPLSGEEYCAAEVLRWRYDDLSGVLRLADARVVLGCCGRRGLSAERVDSMIEVTERDGPDPVSGRCDRECAFDLSLSLPGVPPGEVYLKLLRDVTDAQGGPELVWAGPLDLSPGAGQIVLDPVAVPECRDPNGRAAAARRGPVVSARTL